MPSQPPTHRRIRMITRLSADEARQRLARSIEKETPLFSLQPRSRAWLFAGTIDGDHFSICRIPAGKRFYANQIDGLIEPVAAGAWITLTIQPHGSAVLTSMLVTGVLSLFGLVLIVGPLYFAVLGQLPWNCGVFPLIIVVFAVFVLRALPTSAATFDLDALTALDHLRTIFAIETELSLDDTPEGHGTRLYSGTVQHGHAADGALRRQDPRFFESQNRLDSSTDLWVRRR